MGLYDPDQTDLNYNNLQTQSPIPGAMPLTKEPEPLSWKEIAQLETGIAESSNWFVSLYHNSGIGDWTKSDPNFNGYARVKDTKYANYPEYFINADNDEEVEVAKTKIDEFEQTQELASRAPSLSFWSGMAWGMADPLLAVPGFGSVKLARIGQTVSTAKTVALGGGIGLAGIGAEEVILQGNNPQQTSTESAIHMAAGAIVGAAFGGLAARSIAKSEAKALANTDINVISDIPIENIDDVARLTAQDDSLKAVKSILEITEDEIPVNLKQVKENIGADDYKSLIERSQKDIDGIGDEIIPTKLKVESSEELISDDELAAVLKPTGNNLDESTGIGADYAMYDVRVAGIPQSVLKTIAIPHVSNPSIEGLASPSAVVRDFTSRIGYMHLPLKQIRKETKLNSKTGKYETIEVSEPAVAPYSLESAMQKDMVEALDFNKAMDASYLKYLQIDPESTGASIKAFSKSRGSNVLKSKDFDRLTMDAMNANDRHVIPEVQERAQYTRSLFNKAWERMKEVGLVDKPPIPSYFKVVYDVPKVIKDRLAFEDALTKLYLNRRSAEVIVEKDGKEFVEKATYDVRTKEIDWELKPGENIKSIKLGERMDVQEAASSASDTVDNILQMGDKALELGDIDRLSFTRGTDSARPRKIVLNEQDYEEIKNWLVQDFRKLTQNYLAGISRAVNYKKLLDNVGVDSPQDLRIRIKDEFKNYIIKIRNNKELTKEKKDKMIVKLNKQAIGSEKLFNDLLAISLGQFRKKTGVDGALRTLNNYNISRLFGGIVMSSLGDPFVSLLKNSIPNALWNGWLSELKQFVTGTRKLKTQDYRNAMTAIQNEMNDLARVVMNPDMSVYGVGKVERVSQVGSDLQMKASGATTWNNFWQKASHNLAEHNIMSYIKKPSLKGSKYLKEIGINDEMANRINQLQAKYGYDVRGTHISNTHLWGMTGSISTKQALEAADLFNNAIRVEVHKSPVITEMLDIPRFFQKSELRRSMVLGKGFGFAAINKVGLSALVRHDRNTLPALTIMAAAGMTVKLLQDKINGRESNYSLNQWLQFGIEKSGIGGMLLDPLFQASYAMKGIEDHGTRAWINEPLDYIMGPTASIINPAYRAILTKTQGQELDKKTFNQVKGLMPYSKLWQLKLLGENK
jgi:hypothetical protein